MSTISATRTKIQESEIDLDTRAQVPDLGSDASAKKWKQVTLDTRKQNVGSQIAAMNAATAQVGFSFKRKIRAVFKKIKHYLIAKKVISYYVFIWIYSEQFC